ncbi:Plasma-membrane_choline transporter and transmembrane domain-containing protein [Hexamita inflata]|uniref:Choline transporter-like protein n=1 Tax=Hexamita inflata TaxID=28002 RepID=A0AA86RCI7_9EUKA|nr:Plasma-membrane choline transporter and transmembrane domain-containing protein [Hexamita inflata]
MGKKDKNPVIQPATDKPTSEQAAPEYSPIADKSKRKCRDIFCLLLFTAFWGLCFAICIYHKVWDNSAHAKLMLEPHDRLRRRCGHDHADQQDMLAADFSKVVTDSKDFSNFCDLAKQINSLTVNCGLFSTIGNTKEELIAARQFFKQVSEVTSNSDKALYMVGFKTNSGKHCIKDILKSPLVATACNPPNDMEYVCDSDFEAYYDAAIDKVNSLPPTGGHLAAYLTFNQFLKADQYEHLSDTLPAKYRFVLNFCTAIPKGTTLTDRADFSTDTVPATFGIKSCSQIMFAGQFKEVSTLVGNFAENFVSQITDQYAAMCIGLAACLLFMIIYFIFLRFFVGLLIWITIIGALGGLAVLAAYLLYQGKKVKDQNQVSLDYFGYVDILLSKYQKYYEGFGWTIVAIDVVCLIVVLIFFKTIRIATAVIKQAMSAIGKVPVIFIFPIFTLIFVIAHLFWSMMAAYMFYLTGTYDASMNAYNFETKTRDAEGLVVYTWDYWGSTKFAVLVFGCIWGAFFFYALLEFNISMMVVQWYFNRERTRKSLKGSMKRSVLYGLKSLGTLAVTSFITSFFFFIRLVFEYVLKRMERANKVGNSKVVKAAIWVTRCCLACIQKIVEWFNRNIQVYAAISGDGYCKSMKGAVKLLMAKIFANLFAKGLSTFFLFIGKVFATAVGATVCGAIIYAKTKQIMFAPTIFTLVGSFFLSYYVIEIVKLVIDTIYFCFLYEETYMMREREGGLKPYAPGDLAKLL